jgi:glucose/arabinose dehydrogenase
MLSMRRGWCAAILFLLACSGAAAQFVCDGVAEAGNTDLQAVTVASGLSAPMGVVSPPGDDDRLYVFEQGGTIRLKKRGDPPGTTSLFLDISARVKSGGEQGLLGMAFSRNWDPVNGGDFYLNYSSGSQFCGIFAGPCAQNIAKFSTADPDVGVDNEQIVMSFEEPQTNHNGGQLLFGPDGMLYIFTGDGGGGDDEGTGHPTCGNGQALGTLLGKVLRIDVEGIDPTSTAPDTLCWSGYTSADGTLMGVPGDNPFADGTGGDCDEIWAYGLRNPWRNSFDALNGDVYIADVGQQCWEELNYATPAAAAAGLNYGWRQMEGDQCFDHINPSNCAPTSTPDCSPACNDPSFTDPVHVYGNPAVGDSVIGGYVYRGCRMPNFHGTYFYGDNGSGIIESFEVSGGTAINKTSWTTQLGRAPNSFTSFGEDNRGEMYMADAGLGRILKIMPPFADLEVSGTGAADQFLLSRTGDWTWEDVTFDTMHPVDYYQVYRGVPNGAFTCIHSTLDTSWAAGGDPMDPAPGQLQAYLVTAVFGTEETSSGNPPRSLSSPCGPP